MTIDAVIVNPVRTPVGKSAACSARSRQLICHHSGSCRPDRTGFRRSRSMTSCRAVLPNGEAPAVGRVAALDAGLPVEVPGLQVDRRCGSGLQAVIDAAMRVQTGVADIVIAGGVESMSRVEFYSDQMRWGVRGGGVELHDRLARARVTAGGKHHPVPGGMLETAENLRREYAISREEQDELALRSHQRAVAAMEEGRFAGRRAGPGAGAARSARHAGGPRRAPRPDVSASARSARLVLAEQDPEATVTAATPAGRTTAPPPAW